jgi:hypothetical protein
MREQGGAIRGWTRRIEQRRFGASDSVLDRHRGRAIRTGRAPGVQCGLWGAQQRWRRADETEDKPEQVRS